MHINCIKIVSSSDKSEKYHVHFCFTIAILDIQLLIVILHAGYSLLALWKTVSERLLY